MVPGCSGHACPAQLPVNGKADRGEGGTLFEGAPPGGTDPDWSDSVRCSG